jgi:hypothetical protein
MPILAYIVFNRHEYAYHASSYLDSFWKEVRGHPFHITYYTRHLWSSFFTIPGPRLFFPDALLIPLPYYWLLLPGFVLALWQKRFEIVLLATISVVGVLVSGVGGTVEHRLLLAIPFWIILMGFAFAALLRLRLRPGFKIILLGVAACILATGFVPSVQYIYTMAKDPSSNVWFKQQEVAVARFLKAIVAGRTPASVPRLERDEFNRVQGVPNPPYETLICATFSDCSLHLFLHDYAGGAGEDVPRTSWWGDNQKILSFCGGHPMFVFVKYQDVWDDNKRAIVEYVPSGKDLKLIWERGPTVEKIIEILRPLRDLATEESIAFSFGGRVTTFCVLNIPYKNIRQFQQRVRDMPDLGPTPMPLQPTAKIGPTPAAASGGWTFCANETKQCNFSGTKQVRYGANGIYTYGTFHDGVVCSNAAFGSDPLFGVIKHCDYADISTPTPTPTPRSRQRSQ